MVLDALVKINDEIDPNLSYRRSCAKVCVVVRDEHRCTNTLACLTPISSLNRDEPHHSAASPAGAQGSGGDLTGLFAQYELISVLHPTSRL